jgi:threonine dehydratase
VRLVTLAEVRAAGLKIAGRVHRTPVVRSAYLSDRLGADVRLKLENLQRTGSFKLRGALNKMAQLSEAERARGVVTVSAGNHAQAVAWAARDAGTHATVVMPARAVRAKVDATRGYGAEVILTEGDLRAVVAEIAESRALTMVPAFDDPAIIAGAGTVGDELMDDVPDADLVMVGVGGGGLSSGIGVAVRGRRAEARVVGVEPEGAAGMRLSLDRGAPQTLDSLHTVADGLAAPWAGDHTFAHVRALLHDVVTIPDSAIVDAMWVLFERCKVVAEPAAAAGLGALLSGAVPIGESASGAKVPTVVCVISGGNVDREKLRTL